MGAARSAVGRPDHSGATRSRRTTVDGGGGDGTRASRVPRLPRSMAPVRPVHGFLPGDRVRGGAHDRPAPGRVRGGPCRRRVGGDAVDGPCACPRGHVPPRARLGAARGPNHRRLLDQVFQHFASEEDAFGYFRSIGRVLRGSLLIQLPLYEWPSSLRLEPLYRARVVVRNLLVRVGGMRLRAYRQSWVGEVLDGLGFADVQFRSFAVPGSAKRQSVVLARR